jgi:hypothetical protein
MPYKDKELAKAYRKRTQVPYMRKWREDNREHHRKYMRNWAAKRRQNKELAKHDYEVSKLLDSTKRNCRISRCKFKLQVAGLGDTYIVSLLAKHSPLDAATIRLYPGIIQIHKKIVLTKRLLKNDNTSNKQL